MTPSIGRRSFITLLGGAAVVWPLSARAQQPAMPVLGILSSATAESYAPRLAAFKQGLKEAGFVEGQNLAIESRWANDQYGLLPGLAADLIRAHQLSLVSAGIAVLLALASNAALKVVLAALSGTLRFAMLVLASFVYWAVAGAAAWWIAVHFVLGRWIVVN